MVVIQDVLYDSFYNVVMLFCFFKDLFILKRDGEEGQRERETISSTVSNEWGAYPTRAPSHHPEMTWAKIKCRTLHRLSRPGTPMLFLNQKKKKKHSKAAYIFKGLYYIKFGNPHHVVQQEGISMSPTPSDNCGYDSIIFLWLFGAHRDLCRCNHTFFRAAMLLFRSPSRPSKYFPSICTVPSGQQFIHHQNRELEPWPSSSSACRPLPLWAWSSANLKLHPYPILKIEPQHSTFCPLAPKKSLLHCVCAVYLHTL